MPIINRFADFHDEITGWRQHIHENPGLMYDVEHTASFVAEKLRSFGVDEIVTGIGKTGVVGVIKGKNNNSGRVVGMRADMDALPIHEETGVAHASKIPGKMHACGHDGHTSMLLGAAKYLAETRNFDGTAIVIFQPAEEGGAGGKAMVDDGMMERFGIQEVYGMHNLPGLSEGEFAICAGPIMAATAEFHITITGLGGHAAFPGNCIDPIMVGCGLVTGLQSIVSRNVAPSEAAVLSVTTIHAGDALNVIPDSVTITGTVRVLKEEIASLMETRMREFVEHFPKAYGATGSLDYRRNYPVTFNHADQTEIAADVAKAVSGDHRVDTDFTPTLGGEDFSYMLESRPGAFIFVGAGDIAQLHNAHYDFNDAIIPTGCSYWVRLTEKLMPAA